MFLEGKDRGTAALLLRPGRWRATVTFLGPAFVVAVAYVDPGNIATNVTAGARYGFTLLWVIVAANLAAMLIQFLSAKLGLATGRNLAEQCRDSYSRPVRVFLWLQAEAVVVMTDLAEVVGGAVALQLVFGTPLFAGALVTVGGMALILYAQHRGRRHFESVIVALLAVVLLAFVLQTVRSGISPAAAATGLVPSFAGRDSVLLAAGIVGATVMPHAVYLHSALTQHLTGPHGADTPARLRAARATLGDVLAALTLAGIANMAILLAATPLAGLGVDTLAQAHEAFAEVSGRGAALAFGLALLASGLAASSVGVYSGQVVGQGFVRLSIPLWLRRAVSILPALAILLSGVDPTTALVVSQVVLSFGIPFALWPLLRFTSDRRLMGELVNRRRTTLAAAVAGGVIVVLDGLLVALLLTG